MVTLALALCACAAGPEPAPDEAGPSGVYPIADGLLATVVGTPPAYRADLPDDAGIVSRSLEPLVERRVPPVLRYAQPLEYALAAQEGAAPLAFIIAGTGASAASSQCRRLMRTLYAVGYHAVCLPSPTSVGFMLGAAEHPVPGYMPADVAALYRLMRAVKRDLAGDLTVTGHVLTGYSLGATEAAFVARHDEARGVFDFERVLLINPAVDVWASVQRMDTLLARNLEGGIDGIPAFVARGLGELRQLYASGDPLQFNQEFLYRAYLAQNAERGDIAAIVGLAFRLELANMAFAADVMVNGDVILPAGVRLEVTDSLDLYMQRSFRLSFVAYLDELLLPYWNRGARDVSRDEIIARASLTHIRDYLAASPHIGVMTNVDDPILDSEGLAFLRATFGARARIFPNGGHLGNLGYREAVAAIQAFFSP